MADNSDIYSRVTNKIIADLERGNLTWHAPWKQGRFYESVEKPIRHNGEAYQGMNVLLLWSASLERGYSSNRWMTYKQAQSLGGQVRYAEKGETVVYADRMHRVERMDDGQEIDRIIPFLKTYTVFNVQQIEGLPFDYYPAVPPVNPHIKPIDRLDRFFERIGATIRYIGDNAMYMIDPDVIMMPPMAVFRDAESFYATLAHELTHWTRHPSRLDRDLKRKRFGDAGYAREELVAEIGAAFLCADLRITPEIRESHAAYIEGWLTVLRNDKRAIFKAAALAQQACTYLVERGAPE